MAEVNQSFFIEQELDKFLRIENFEAVDGFKQKFFKSNLYN